MPPPQHAPDPDSLVIIGAGVVGCAIAWAASQTLGLSGESTVVLEAAARPGTGISSRNSGVVHAGLYYEPGSRKARTCVAGNRLVWDWVAARGVGHRQTGKLLVARDAQEEAQLDALVDNAAANGVALERVTLAQARALEPALPPTVRAAGWSPSSGIVDAHGLVRSLQIAAEQAGVSVVCSAPVTRIEPLEHGFALTTPRGSMLARRVINAAGLGATRVAKLVGLTRAMHLARGDYFRLRRQPAWRRLIYPVTVPGSPSLGVHLTLELDGGCRLGPDLAWVEDPEDFSPARGELQHAGFLAAARALLGPCEAGDLVYDSCGIRPKLVGPGAPAGDFEIIEHPRGCWHLLGIESPGLTAALALAHELIGVLDNTGPAV
ncbi:Aminobutyraldehyde dehydrogenase [Enhygromyxa salina]|uniref:Aminobutyraldehyde dehydrogenase n=1 Tax=Enhygromyxa salina TaxID=215803 RepID=A0A0C1ZLM7_9BACT|nr:NAD(P)/FAD-dependent oxidoreductase [Enhygromyxa salina]KIG11673.1 Aminobutyraldehyde dehydrogenase [Enhygromyxa salina]